jgi:hypothetical protein
VNYNTRRGYVDGNNDGIIQLNEKGDFITFGTIDIVNKYMGDVPKFFTPIIFGGESNWNTWNSGIGYRPFRLGRPGIFYENQSMNTFTAKSDFTSQLNSNHQFKTGILLKINDVDMDRISSSIGGIDIKRNYLTERWNVKPLEFGIYAEDKIEYSGLSINIGTRVDMFDPKASDYADWFKPYNIEYRTYIDGSYKEMVPQRGDKIKPYWFISPRISVSHPISGNTVIYYLFSMISQPQPLSMLYTNYNDFGSPSLPGIASVASKPYKTTNYEIGGRWEIIKKLIFNMNAYYRNIENYNVLSFMVQPSYSSGILYYVYFSGGYAEIRGADVQIEILPLEFKNFLKISGKASYTYNYIGCSKILDMNEENPDDFYIKSSDSSKYVTGLPFDNVNCYQKIETRILGGQSDLTNGYDRTHKIGYTLFLEFPLDITLTSIGTFRSGFFYIKADANPRVAGRELTEGPWNTQIDLRLEKSFSVLDKYRIIVYADVKNLFNKKNILAYDNTISGESLWENEQNPVGKKNRPIGYDGTLFYDIPREFYFGVTIDF